ncbi:MAG: protein kinase, partial [Oligoflexales bacterium]|nr:protein kinase [Oligoflexales bacterium]
MKDCQIKKLIGETNLFVIYRARQEGSGETFILKVLRNQYPAAEDLAILEHDCRMAQKICSEFVIKACRVEKLDDGRTAMIMEDIGGSDLKEFIKSRGRLPVDLFLEIALAIIRGIHDIHGANIIHKDINPGNILYNPETKRLKIADFHIATELSRESQEINIKGVLEGSLSYISPEQTGRMNRFLDYRTDFYSLGATFYELLTGVTMFEAKDAMGYVAAHISKMPPRVDRINREVPKLIADIIEILIAKSPEERYQSSLGLIHDLSTARQCLKEKGEITPFSLKSRDISERFEIPQKLFGREEQKGKLLALFEEASRGKSKILLVRGHSGIGKSALIHEILRCITIENGFFLKGKYDQFASNIPYFALIQAFKSAMNQIM